MKIKIFNHKNYDFAHLEQNVNNWIASQKHLSILQIAQSQSQVVYGDNGTDINFTLTIFYI